MPATSEHSQCYELYCSQKELKRCLREGHPTLILMRGIQGSGKSTLATELLNYSRKGSDSGVILSTDALFMVNGEYQFDITKLDDHHKTILKNAKKAMKDDVKPIIIDNTNIRAHHMKAFIQQAVVDYYEVYIVEPDTEWRRKPGQCVKKNLHQVNKQQIEKTLELLESEGKPSFFSLSGRVLRLEPPLDDDSEREDESPNQCSSVLVTSREENVLRVFNPSTEAHVTDNLSIDISSRCDELRSGSEDYDDSYGETDLDSPEDYRDDDDTSASCTSFFGTNTDVQSENAAQNATVLPNTSRALFSLAPVIDPHVKHVEVRTISTQTTEVTIVLQENEPYRSLPTHLSDFIIKDQCTLKVKTDSSRSIKDRASNTEPYSLPDEVDALTDAFPLFMGFIPGLLEDHGFQEAILLCADMCPRENNQPVVMQSQLVANTNQRSKAPNRSKGVKKTWDMNITNMRNPMVFDDVSNQEQMKVEVHLGNELCEKLEMLFGNENIDHKRSKSRRVEVPVFLLEALYDVWQAYKKNQGEEEPDVSLDRDYATALQLQIDENEKNNSSENTGMNQAQTLNLKKLLKTFDGMGVDQIKRVYEDEKYNYDTSKSTLKLLMNRENEPDLPHETASVIHSTTRRRTDRNEMTISEAQRLAFEYHMAVEKLRLERDEEKEKLRLLPNAAVLGRQPCADKIRNLGLKMQENKLKASQLLKDANRRSNHLDFHMMNVADALELLKEKLTILDRPSSSRRGQSSTKLRVITGYGRNSQGAAKLRPAVKQFLDQQKYTYTNTNRGEFVITCK